MLFTSITRLSFVHVFNSIRLISTTSVKSVKEIKIKQDGKKTVIEGVIVPSDRSDHLFNLDGLGDPRQPDPIIRLGLKLRHTDVQILSQFLKPDGGILSNHVTKISSRSQKLIEMLIERSRRAGLLPLEIQPDGSHVYFNGGFHKFNVYYDSDIIGLPKKNKIEYKYNPPK